MFKCLCFGFFKCPNYPKLHVQKGGQLIWTMPKYEMNIGMWVFPKGFNHHSVTAYLCTSFVGTGGLSDHVQRL